MICNNLAYNTLGTFFKNFGYNPLTGGIFGHFQPRLQNHPYGLAEGAVSRPTFPLHLMYFPEWHADPDNFRLEDMQIAPPSNEEIIAVLLDPPVPPIKMQASGEEDKEVSSLCSKAPDALGCRERDSPLKTEENDSLEESEKQEIKAEPKPDDQLIPSAVDATSNVGDTSAPEITNDSSEAEDHPLRSSTKKLDLHTSGSISEDEGSEDAVIETSPLEQTQLPSDKGSIALEEDFVFVEDSDGAKVKKNSNTTPTQKLVTQRVLATKPQRCATPPSSPSLSKVTKKDPPPENKGWFGFW